MMDQIGLGDVAVGVTHVELQWIIDHRKWHGLTISNSNSSRRRAITTKLMKRSITEVVTTCISMIRPGRVVVKVENILILITNTTLLIGVVDTNRDRVEVEVGEGVEEQEVEPSGLMLQQGVAVQRREKVTHNNNFNKLKIMIMRQRLPQLRLVHLHSWVHSSGNNRWDIREGDLGVVCLAEGVGGQEDLAVPQCQR